MALLTCPECGKQISDKSEMCNSCGCPISEVIKSAKEQEAEKKREKINKIIAASVIALSLLILLLVVIKLITKPDTSGYFCGLKWGTTFGELSNKITGEEVNVNDEKNEISQSIEDFEGMEGVTAYATYEFEKGKLYKVSLIIFINEEKTDMTDIEFKKIYTERLDEIYGEGKKESSSTTIWETENSLITLWSYKSLTSIKYTDINYEEE